MRAFFLQGCEGEENATPTAVKNTDVVNEKVESQAVILEPDLDGFPEREMVHQAILTLQSGQTLTSLFEPLGVSAKELYLFAKLVSPEIKVNKLKSGVQFAITQEHNVLTKICMKSSFEKEICLVKVDSEWLREDQHFEVTSQYATASVRIESSLYELVSNTNVSMDVFNQLMLALSHFVDFQRDIRQGDTLNIVYEVLENSRGEQLIGELQQVALVGQLHQLALYRFTDDEGNSAFYHKDGTLAQSFLLKTPVDGAKLSSKFGKRHHPVLGYTRVHKGLDFSAPLGTPVMAAGNGKIVHASRAGSFGNMVKIKHNNGYTTLYAHLKGFGNAIKVGKKVKQGQVIGYLGNTGLSQSRHLHYEVHQFDKAINPLSLKGVSDVQLTAREKPQFNAWVTKMDALHSATVSMIDVSQITEEE
ncbi:M23 family metallopeptidase [Pseudoalteromonas xiamenensis]|uniref:M23 family metallopeptidase n=1 Tax=Pseudoalteromonas xiamenensis TaxID=882626 RepID=UPI0027E47F18|nr:M23 family metallopeptidase [Pseudoalteromonas xiamenensis]WMN59670.1 M23 family metallopeptidase [Pseudoalteromonas xiamenensis]